LPGASRELQELANVEVRKDYLNRKVTIILEERKRDVIWCLTKKEECFWTDETGLIFSSAPLPSGSLIVKVIRDHSDRELKIGDRVLDEELFGNLQLIFKLLDEVDLSVSEFRIDDLKFKEATVITGGGPEIYFSLLLDPQFGKSVINSLRGSSEWDIIRYVDLRVENRAYYSL